MVVQAVADGADGVAPQSTAFLSPWNKIASAMGMVGMVLLAVNLFLTGRFLGRRMGEQSNDKLRVQMEEALFL